MDLDDVEIIAAEAAHDQLAVNALGGNDRVDASALPAGVIQRLSVDGGTGDDRLIGSDGPDALDGGAGHDVLDGRDGVDAANGEVLLNIP
jgi:Ca2+-binding RTX toxin-like protein